MAIIKRHMDPLFDKGDRILAMEEALEWYGDLYNYSELAPSPGDIDGIVPIEKDLGERARKALARATAAPQQAQAGKEKP